jgi:cytoskeletal protein RodZ
MGIGIDLRQARQQAGLSAEQIAERTKVKLEKIEALEQEVFEHLPPGIYLDGIVRAYAQEVGVDPTAAVAQLHAETVPIDAPLHNIDLVATAERDPLGNFPAEAEVAVAPVVPAEAHETGVAALRRSLVPVLTLAVLALLTAFGIGLYLRSVTRSTPDVRADATDATQRSVATARAPAPQQQAAPEQSVAAVASAPPERSAAAPGGAVGERARVANRSAVTENQTRRADPAPERAIARDAADQDRRAARASSGDLTGAWWATTRVNSASVERYKGLTLGYRLQLQQTGNRVTGTGFKATENGRAISPRARTPITLEGSAEGTEVMLTFTEQGLRRTSRGQFVLTMANDGALRGRFESDAARSRGTIEARRQP